MRLVFIGLSLSSSWGNGHATTYRALLRALAERGHDILFLEHDKPWYAAHRDLPHPDFCRLELYGDGELERWRDAVQEADAVVVGSYVVDGKAVGRWAIDHARGPVLFYDIDTPVTLAALERGSCDYLSAELIAAYDGYLSFTGGPTLLRLMRDYGSPHAGALYCSVDETRYRPVEAAPRYDLGYLGTYSPDRQPTLDRLLVEPARQAPELRFVVAGPQYPETIEWPANVTRLEHVPPADHPAFYGSCRWTLNVTRADMIAAGWSPSVRLFEAAACGTPMISDRWDGIQALFQPGREILLPETPSEVVAILRGTDEETRRAIADEARHAVLSGHTAAHRAAEFEAHVQHCRQARASRPAVTPI
jgi:spore maturation protein CgeB